MDESPEYIFLLDFFPLIDVISEHNETFADVLQRTALELLHTSHEQLRLERVTRLHLFLRLAADLGYVEQEVLVFLEKQLKNFSYEGIK